MKFRISMLAAAIILLYTIQAKKDYSNDDNDEKKRKEPEDLGRTNPPGRKMNQKPFDNKTNRYRPYYTASSSSQRAHETTDLNQLNKTIGFTARPHNRTSVEYIVQFDEKAKIRCKVESSDGRKFIMFFVGVRTAPGSSKQIEQKCIPPDVTRTYFALDEAHAIRRCEEDHTEWVSFYCKGVLEWCGHKTSFFIKRAGSNTIGYNVIPKSLFESNKDCNGIIKRPI